MIPGSKNTYDIALQPTEHIFEAGHRIGIVVAGNIYGAGASGSIPSGSARPSRSRSTRA